MRLTMEGLPKHCSRVMAVVVVMADVSIFGNFNILDVFTSSVVFIVL